MPELAKNCPTWAFIASTRVHCILVTLIFRVSRTTFFHLFFYFLECYKNNSCRYVVGEVAHNKWCLTNGTKAIGKKNKVDNSKNDKIKKDLTSAFHNTSGSVN